jgi:hypothetical protein
MTSDRRRVLCASMILAAGLYVRPTDVMAATETLSTLRLDLSQAYGLSAWQGENTPIFHTTTDGQLVLIPGNYSYDKLHQALISSDNGRTWKSWDAFSSWPTMGYADVVRQGKELLAFGFHSNDAYTGTRLWRSSDEGATWTGGSILTTAASWAPMNQRVLQTSTGRIIVPVEQLLGSEGAGANQVGTIYSDNSGQSWSRSPLIGPPAGYPTAPEGIGEPAVVELPNGKLWMVCRGLGGRLWQSFSTDDGATWATASQTTLVSPLSAVNAKRIPGTDAVVAIWNNATPGTSTNWSDSSNVWRPRSPLVFAVSKDNCQTWSDPVVIESGTAAYPSISFLNNEMFVSYWEDPDPTAVFLNSNSHLTVVAYGIPSLLQVPEPSTIILLLMAGVGLLGNTLRRYMCLVLMLALGGITNVKAADEPPTRFRLNLSKTYSMEIWYSEVSPILHCTDQGQLILLPGNNSLGKPPHAMISDDKGRTWHNWDAYRTWPKMAYADVARHGNQLLAFGFNDKDCYKGTYVWWSSDHGLTWSGGKRLTADKDRWAPMNNRVLVTSRGRVIVPVEQLLGAEGPDANQIGTIYSDDAGRSWARSPIFGPPPPLPSKPEGFGEPSVVELPDGQLWMVFRTRLGHLWQAWSSDGGATWGKPSSTGLVSPLSAVNAKRIPGTDTVIVFWNNAKPGETANWNTFPNFWTPRSPLVFATSRDGCKTWSRPIIVDKGTAAYPSLCFLGDELFAVYWTNPDPNVPYLSPKSYLTLVVYDIRSVAGDGR